MTIHLPVDLESSVAAIVQSGRFPSMDDAMAEAARILLREIGRQDATHPSSPTATTDHGSIGAMKDAADELDEAMKYASQLRQQPWRVAPVE